jgi:hypothetical protein
MAWAGDGMISEKLAEGLAAFDDQALATLANAGLLRRAQRDLDQGKATLIGIDGDQASVEVDGNTVKIGSDGPAKSSCTCPAVGVCRHRIAAVLLLRTVVADAEPGNAPVDSDGAEVPVAPSDWLADITLEQARKFSGRPGWRAALELLEEAIGVEAGATSCAVTFASLEEPVLILRGQGMAGIVSKATKARKKAYHGAALIAAYRHLGLAISLEEGDAAKASDSSRPSPPDESFLGQVRAALLDCAQLGFNLAPLPIEERMFELSVSSRADALPRLSALLRAVAAQMRLRRQHSFEFDASEMLELVVTAYAITFAVSREALELPQYLRLAGEARRNYANPASIELIGCGAEEWVSSTGARGVTAHFVEPQSAKFYSVAIARGAGQDPMFVPRDAWKQQALWQAGTMETLSHARILLHNAGIADGGRLAASKDVRADILEKEVVPDYAADYVHREWEALHETLASRFGLGVDANGQPQIALIQPAELARPQFDELAQRLVLPIRDATGRWIALTMDHQERSHYAISEIEKLLTRKWTGMILVRAFQTGSQIELSPVTMFDAKKPIDLTLIRPVFRWGMREKKAPNVLGWLNRLRPDPGRALSFAQPPRSAHAVMEAWRHILDRLEAGPKLARMLDDKRAAHGKRLGDYGMTQLAEYLSQADGGANLLTAAYALLIARQQRVQLPYLA